MDADRIARCLSGAPHTRSRRVPLPRRDFLRLSALAGGGLAIAWHAPLALAEGAAPDAPKALPDPQPFVHILADNTVEITVNRLDFGQGALTALPMLLAEELDVDWSQVKAGLAPAGDAYKDPLFGIQMTGGSNAVAHSWLQYRQVGAATRAMLIAAAAEQWKVPVASCTTGSGVVRSGSHKATYAALAEGAARQPVPATVTLKSPRQYRIIGKGKPRLDVAAGATGKKKYGIDMRLPGMTVALLQHAPVFGGQVAGFDAGRALAVKGVRDIFQVPTDRGGSGIAIVADGYWPAKQARDLLQVTWKTGVGSTVSSDALLASFRDAARQPALTAIDRDVSGAAAAVRHVGGEYHFAYLAHAPMEPLNATFELKPGAATVWAGSQFQTLDQAAIAQTLGLKPAQVNLITLPAGGGFGRRAVPTSDYLREGAAIAKAWYERQGDKAGPVKLMWSREDDIRGGYYRPAHLHTVDAALDADGKLLAWDHVIVGQSIVKGTPFEGFLVKNGIDGTMTEGVAENVYGLPMRLRVTHPDVAVPVLWWRSVGNTHTAFVMETMVDEVAHAAGTDPVAWRMARFAAGGHERHRAALQLAVDKSGYGGKLPAGHAWGAAVHESFGSVVAYVVDVSIVDGRPKVHRATAGVHANQIVNPLAAEAQVQGAAIFGFAMTQPGFEITLKDGVVQQSQFTDFTPPRMTEAFAVAVHFVPSDEAPTGLGEPGVPAIAPAVANALAALTGKRLRTLPLELPA
jgi:isoquinoline 1-oxidoreductase beta subunit